jgi:hypothetical protein
MIQQAFLDQRHQSMSFDALGKRQSLWVRQPVPLEFGGCFTMTYRRISIIANGAIQDLILYLIPAGTFPGGVD